MAACADEFMRQLVSNFVQDPSSSSNNTLWDWIVISAADNAQKDCFERQLRTKIEDRALFSNANYLVIADPPGPPLGSGGATMHILLQLEEKFQIHLSEKRILIIHAGGFSKRLPNCSCVGKLFCPLPIECDGRSLSILDLKLIITSPFAKLMKYGGVFITCSDDIETFSLEGAEENLNANHNGVVAMAHPSSIAIGETHGVYILPKRIDGKTCWFSECVEVLQKPCEKLMKEKGAIYVSSSGEKHVYTDSMFWCGPDLVKKMVKFSKECRDIYLTETCIFGDFLACMGSRPAKDKFYLQKISCNSKIKQDIAANFQDTPLNIVVLEKSKFFHLGTMEEYLDNLEPGSELFNSLGMKPLVNCNGTQTSLIEGVVTNSIFESQVRLYCKTVVDYCIVSTPLVIGAGSILSNCLINFSEIDIIPANWLFHTASVLKNDSMLYVTISFHIQDNLKGSVDKSFSWNHCANYGLCSLWNAPLFEARATMDQSFYATWLRVVKRDAIQQVHSESSHFFSMADVVHMKYVDGFLAFRRTINDRMIPNVKTSP